MKLAPFISASPGSLSPACAAKRASFVGVRGWLWVVFEGGEREREREVLERGEGWREAKDEGDRTRWGGGLRGASSRSFRWRLASFYREERPLGGEGREGERDILSPHTIGHTVANQTRFNFFFFLFWKGKMPFLSPINGHEMPFLPS